MQHLLIIKISSYLWSTKGFKKRLFVDLFFEKNMFNLFRSLEIKQLFKQFPMFHSGFEFFIVHLKSWTFFYLWWKILVFKTFLICSAKFSKFIFFFKNYSVDFVQILSNVFDHFEKFCWENSTCSIDKLKKIFKKHMYFIIF